MDMQASEGISHQREKCQTTFVTRFGVGHDSLFRHWRVNERLSPLGSSEPSADSQPSDE